MIVGSAGPSGSNLGLMIAESWVEWAIGSRCLAEHESIHENAMKGEFAQRGLSAGSQAGSNFFVRMGFGFSGPNEKIDAGQYQKRERDPRPIARIDPD